MKPCFVSHRAKSIPIHTVNCQAINFYNVRAPFYLIIFVAIICGSCQPKAYIVEGFEERTADHVAIAVLPFDIVYSGRRTKEMTDEYLEERRAWEAVAFQKDLVDRITQRATRNRRLRVDLQSPSETNALLIEAGIDPADAHNHSVTQLTQLLGVDAVISAFVQKNKILTPLESAAADVALTVLTLATGIGGGLGGMNRTYDIDISITAMDQLGTTLYRDAAQISINYSNTSDQAISQVNRRLMRQLPYIEGN